MCNKQKISFLKKIEFGNIMAACRTIFNRVSAFINGPSSLLTRIPLPCSQLCASVRNKNFSEIGIPIRPKRPLVPFFRFMQKTLPRIKQENPTLKHVDHLKILGKKWQELPPEDKLELKQQADSEREEFQKNLASYKSSLTDEQIINIGLQKIKLIKNIRERKSKIKKLYSDKPKKPLTSWILYFRECIQNTPSADKPHKELIKHFSLQWKSLPYEQRRKYRVGFEEKNKQFKTDLLEWEKKMYEKGNTDVIRKKTLRKLIKEKKEKKEANSIDDNS